MYSKAIIISSSALRKNNYCTLGHCLRNTGKETFLRKHTVGGEKPYGICKEGVVISDKFLPFEIER